MSDIPLYDEGQAPPEALPRAEVRFTEAAARPYSDGRRVRLNFKLTPFLERPSVDVAVTNTDGLEVASLSLIEAMDTEFDFTIHLRGPEPRGEHSLHLALFYPESDDDPTGPRQVVDQRTVRVDIPSAA